jgi:hypothetical protein
VIADMLSNRERSGAGWRFNMPSGDNQVGK